MTTESTGGRTFPTWNTIQLGTHKTGAELLAAIENMRDGAGNPELGSMDHEGYALVRELTPRISMAVGAASVELVATSMKDLGLPSSTRLDVIEATARRYGLCRCVPETAFQVRLQKRQQHREGLYMLVSPIESIRTDIRFSLYGLGNKQMIMAKAALPEDEYGDTSIFLWQRVET